MGEIPDPSTGELGTHKEHGTSFAAPKGKSTPKPDPAKEVGSLLVPARERRQKMLPILSVVMQSEKESLVPKNALKPVLRAPQRKRIPDCSLISG